MVENGRLLEGFRRDSGRGESQVGVKEEERKGESICALERIGWEGMEEGVGRKDG